MYKNFFSKKKNYINNVDYQRKIILKYKKFEKYDFLKKNFTQNSYLKKSQLMAICKINGTLKKTNKRTNISRHMIRKHQNNKYFSGWTQNSW